MIKVIALVSMISKVKVKVEEGDDQNWHLEGPDDSGEHPFHRPAHTGGAGVP